MKTIEVNQDALVKYIYTHCPLDCPRLNTKEYGCDKGRCPKVKATIKELKA